MKTLALSFFLCFGAGSLLGQIIPEDKRRIPVLVFENFDQGEIRFIKEGGALKYVLRGDTRMVFKGKLDSLDDKTMTVSGKLVHFENCRIIKGRVRSDKEMIGALLAGVGFTSIGFGAGLFGTSIAGAGSAGGVGAVLFGAGMAMMFNKKKFNLNRGWTVHGGSIEYNWAD